MQLLNILPLVGDRRSYVLVRQENNHHAGEQIEAVVIHLLLEVNGTSRSPCCLTIYVVRALAHETLPVRKRLRATVIILAIEAEVC